MPKRDLQPLQIHRMLPRTNCKQCGSAACYAFAFDLISHSKRPDDCPPLLTEKFADSYRILKELLGAGDRIKGTDHVLDKTRCTGCGDCVTICNRALTTITKGGRYAQRAPVPPPMKIIDGNLSVVEWKSCKRATPGLDICNLCAEKCPFSAIDLVKAEEESDEE